MAKVQWYPGHMHKACREIGEALPGVDVVVELLDARLPCSSANPMLRDLCAERPVVRLLTKSDLADPELTRIWIDWYRDHHCGETRAVTVGSKQETRQVAELCRAALPDREGAIVAMVAGIPNVGKSTLINLLAGRAVARTGDEPAVTRQQQRINIGNGVVLLDTPGMLWPNLENPVGGLRLAATGAIRETALSHLDVACYLADFLAAHHPSRLDDRYQSRAAEAVEVVRAIGHRRGCLGKGGVVDMDRAARVLINDFRSGALGRITLETPAMVAEEWQAVASEREERAKRKAERKANRKGGPANPQG